MFSSSLVSVYAQLILTLLFRGLLDTDILTPKQAEELAEVCFTSFCLFKINWPILAAMKLSCQVHNWGWQVYHSLCQYLAGPITLAFIHCSALSLVRKSQSWERCAARSGSCTMCCVDWISCCTVPVYLLEYSFQQPLVPSLKPIKLQWKVPWFHLLGLSHFRSSVACKMFAASH